MKKVELPKTLGDFLDPEADAQIEEARRLLTAFKSLRVQIYNTSTGTTSTGTIQINGSSALIIVNV